jgi:hypothetical protein
LSIAIPSLRRADCDTDHCLAVTKVRERFAVSEQEALKFVVERFNFKNISELEVRKQCQIKISNRFAASDNVNKCEDIHRA